MGATASAKAQRVAYWVKVKNPVNDYDLAESHVTNHPDFSSQQGDPAKQV